MLDGVQMGEKESSLFWKAPVLSGWVLCCCHLWTLLSWSLVSSAFWWKFALVTPQWASGTSSWAWCCILHPADLLLPIPSSGTEQLVDTLGSSMQVAIMDVHSLVLSSLRMNMTGSAARDPSWMTECTWTDDFDCILRSHLQPQITIIGFYWGFPISCHIDRLKSRLLSPSLRQWRCQTKVSEILQDGLNPYAFCYLGPLSLGTLTELSPWARRPFGGSWRVIPGSSGWNCKSQRIL